MRGYAIGAAAALLLAGCGGNEAGEKGAGAGGDGVSNAEVAERAKAAIRPQAGQYRTTMQLVDIEIPGAPQSAIDMMRKMMDGQSHEYCLTPSDVEQGFEEMAKQSQDGDCSYEKFDVSGSKIDALMRCKGETSMTMAMTGSVTETSAEMDMTMKGDMTGMGDSTIQMRAKHTRIGDCAG
ncbi:DUF3617 domain-containing protein [Qipengyuania marisflavi]|uniref:DUF3617 domain-containing protein n=1 Tax=Qipengyuania marisflavi TaxID=2486356 RepID=A0A5S3PAD4_9SPHN|nr:DUF3617 domain-containing protein [Qipengyuania marisflavi]TMM50411.1 DUF3617 domain-containing protein [Qipengyuania marisflavi]